MSGSEEKRSLIGRWFGRSSPKGDEGKPVEAAPQQSPTRSEAEPAAAEAPETDRRGGGDSAKSAIVHVEGAAAGVPETTRTGWFQRLKAGLAKTSSKISEGIATVFSKRRLDAESLAELEDLLIQADLGVDTSMRIVDAVGKGKYDKGISADDVRAVLAEEVAKVLRPVAVPFRVRDEFKPHVILVVGVNGTGKTTTIGKLAHQFVREGRSVVLAAGDTFRAAAIDQLKIWGERIGAPVVSRNVGADSAGLAFDALSSAREAKADILMIDTAGRLQNKQELMAELEKVVRVIRKLDPTAPHDVLLVLDATTGQNALNQVDVFRDKAGVTGLIMTKLDGTARGGILVAIAAKHGLPVHAIGVGEGAEDLQPFVAEEFARALALN